MKSKRVDCSDCEHFTNPSIYASFGIIKLKPEEKAKCTLGKRVMFRLPNSPESKDDTWGWIRYCNDFKSKQDESTEIP